MAASPSEDLIATWTLVVTVPPPGPSFSGYKACHVLVEFRSNRSDSDIFSYILSLITFTFILSKMSAVLYSLVSALVLSQGALAVGTAFGYAAGTTGGGSATPAVPSSTAELVSW